MLWYTLPDLSCMKQTQRESTEAPMNDPEETSDNMTLHNRALIDQHEVKVIHVQIFCIYFWKYNKKMLYYYIINIW